MKICPDCKEYTEDGANFCPACGYRFVAASVPLPPLPDPPHRARVADRSGFAAAGLALGVTGLAFSAVILFTPLLSVPGMIFSILSIRSQRRGTAVAGCVLNGLALAAAVACLIWLCYFSPAPIGEWLTASGKTVSIREAPPGEEGTLPEDPPDSPPVAKDSGTLGDYAVAIKGCQWIKDADGMDAAAIRIDFTNGSDRPVSFAACMDVTAYQNGVRLEDARLVGDGRESNSGMELWPGAGLALQKSFILQDTVSPVEVEITGLADPSGGKLRKTFAFA